MVSALESGSSGPGSSPGQGYYIVLLGKTLYSPVPISTQVNKRVPSANLMMFVERWGGLVSHLGKVTENGISSSKIGNFGPMQTNEMKQTNKYDKKLIMSSLKCI